MGLIDYFSSQKNWFDNFLHENLEKMGLKLDQKMIDGKPTIYQV